MFWSCKSVVSRLTDDEEGRCTRLASSGIRLHLSFCGECCLYLKQVRAVRAALGALEGGAISEETRTLLMNRFRAWHATLAKTSS